MLKQSENKGGAGAKLGPLAEAEGRLELARIRVTNAKQRLSAAQTEHRHMQPEPGAAGAVRVFLTGGPESREAQAAAQDLADAERQWRALNIEVRHLRARAHDDRVRCRFCAEAIDGAVTMVQVPGGALPKCDRCREAHARAYRERGDLRAAGR